MKLTIASGGNREQHFVYWVRLPLGHEDMYINLRELVIPPFAQVTAPDDLAVLPANVADVTTQLRQAGFVTPAEVVSGKSFPGTYSFA